MYVDEPKSGTDDKTEKITFRSLFNIKLENTLMDSLHVIAVTNKSSLNLDRAEKMGYRKYDYNDVFNEVGGIALKGTVFNKIFITRAMDILKNLEGTAEDSDYEFYFPASEYPLLIVLGDFVGLVSPRYVEKVCMEKVNGEEG